MGLSDADLKLLDELAEVIQFDSESLDDVEFGSCSNCNTSGGNNSGSNAPFTS